MRIPLGWLAELVAWSEPTTTLVERMTMVGLKVESVDEVGDLDAAIRAGRLLAVEPHPQAERLQVCRVDVGEAAPRVVVSAAPGLVAGQVVPVALDGARLPGGREVRVADLRGVTSAGMLCSETELALGEDGDRVLELEGDVAPGTAMRDLPGVRDTVVEIEVTANRGDWLSMLGVARELAAVSTARLVPLRQRVRESGAPAAAQVTVRVEVPELCPRYCARVVRGVTIRRSPLPVRLRLRYAGMRPINAVVDATNYVMLEQGQPLHAFDLARVADGTIVVRRARAGERLVTLDGVDRALEAGDLVIADPRGPIALAGVMGGQSSEVVGETRDVLLESAFFAPASVRRTSRRLGLASQASYRFERRVDPERVPAALDGVAAMLARLAGGSVAPGQVEDAAGMAALAPKPIAFRGARALGMLGLDLPRGEVGRRLRALGVSWTGSGATLQVTPPSYRGDLAHEEDLAEEIARVGGFDAVPSTLPLAPIIPGADEPMRAAARRVRRLLAAEGLSEMVTLAFTDADTNRALPGFVGAELAPIVVRNPLSVELSELRRSPLAGLARALRLNVAQGSAGVTAFEIGKAFGRRADGGIVERRATSILLWGSWPARGVERVGPPVDFDDLKGIAANLLAGLGVEDEAVRWRAASDVSLLHPGKTARLELADRVLGVAGALHPRVAQACDLPQEVWVLELDFEDLAHYRPRRVGLRPLPRFPAVTRDIAVIVDEVFEAEAIVEEVRGLRDPLIESVTLFDCYRGTPIPAAKKSLAYSIAYRAAERTLTDEEVNAIHDRVRAHLRDRFAVELRS